MNTIIPMNYIIGSLAGFMTMLYFCLRVFNKYTAADMVAKSFFYIVAILEGIAVILSLGLWLLKN
jgi:Na+(H+)/acetate symporter ActP